MKKDTFRKVFALGTGIAMLGATLLGATAAADLAQYPAPMFIQDGTFNGNIVVGKAASTEDVLGAIEIAASLQTAAIKRVPIAGTGMTASVDKENVKIRQTGRDFTYDSSIKDTFGGSLDFSDLPTLLKSGEFRDSHGANKDDQTYTQTLDFLTTSGQLTFRAADGVYNDTADSYLWFDDGSNKYMYVYKLEFDTAVQYDNTSSANAKDDLQNNVIEIQGNKYTITDISLTSGKLNKMELLAGETVIWMTQGEPLTKAVAGTDHTVLLTDVNEAEDKCGISVDGTQVWVDKGDTTTINGVEVGVTDAIVVHSAAKDTDVCQVNVGATKITLQDGQEVKKDDSEVSGSTANFLFENSGSTAKWKGFNLTFVPDDKVFLNAGASFVDPVLNNFQFDFAGMSKVTDKLEWESSGRNAALTFDNYDGKEVKVEWKMDSVTDKIALGKDTDKQLLRAGDHISCGSTGPADCEDKQIFFVTSGNVIHILEMTNINDADHKISLRDKTYDIDYTDKDYTYGTSTSVDLGSIGTLPITFGGPNNAQVQIGSFGSAVAYTKYKGIVTLQPEATLDVGDGPTQFDQASFYVSEKTDSLATAATNNAVWKINGAVDTTNHEIDWNDPIVASSNWVSASIDKNDDNSDDKLMATEFGTIASWDSRDHRGGELDMPEDQAYANAFISKVGAVMIAGGTGGESIVFQPIQVGTAKLDTDITDIGAQNMVVIGGPCANSVAAALTGTAGNCSAGYVPGEASIRLWSQTNGNVAILAAGYSAADTRRASTVLANYKTYAPSMKGTQVTVKGTTLSDITVSPVVA